jgi:hypothetical protein
MLMRLSGLRYVGRRGGSFLLSTTALSLLLVGCKGDYYYGAIGLAIRPLSFLRDDLREQLTSDGLGGDGGKNVEVNIPEEVSSDGDNSGVGDFSVAGLLPGSLVGYEILPDKDGSLFSVSNLGELRFKDVSSRDYEKEREYNLVLRVNSEGESKDYEVKVKLDNVDEGPVFLGMRERVSVDENSPTTRLVESFEARDPEGDSVMYSVTKGSTDFSVDSGGQLHFLTSPNFEDRSSYDVEVEALSGGKTTRRSLRVEIGDENEAPEYSSARTAVSVLENAPSGGDLAFVKAEDPEGGVLSYMKNGGADDNLFTLTEDMGGVKVTFVSSRDFEMSESMGVSNAYVLKVLVSDGFAGNEREHEVVVTVLNEDERPVFMGVVPLVMWTENEPSSDVVKMFEAEDPEMASVTYRLSGGADDGLFSLDMDSGELRFKVSPDFEMPNSADGDNVYKVEVEASDGTTSAVTYSLDVEVEGENEAPSFVGFVGSIDYNEEQEATTVLTTLMGTDPDAGNVLMFSISGGSDRGLFVVGESSGELRFMAKPDFEAMGDADRDNEYELEVKVSDGSLEMVETLRVMLLNVNEVLSFDSFVSSGVSYDTGTMTVVVNENTTAVGTLSATDVDGDTVTYMLEGADAGLFSISGTGEITFMVSPDFEVSRSDAGTRVYDLTVRAMTSDDDITTDLAVSVQNVNEAPMLTGGTTSVTWKKGLTPAAFDISLLFSDEDAGDMLTYATTLLPSWLELTAGGEFRVVSGRVVGLENPGGVNDVRAEDLSVTVTAMDSGGLSVSETVVFMLEASDNAGVPEFMTGTPMIIRLLENFTDSILYRFLATDSDALDRVTYSLVLNGEPNGYFSVSSLTGDFAISSMGLNFEESPSLDANGDKTFSLTILAMSRTDETRFDFDVVLEDVSERPILDGGAAPLMVDVTSLNRDSIHTFMLSGADAGSTYSFMLYGRDSDLYMIDSASGELSLLSTWTLSNAFLRGAVHEVTVVGTSSRTGFPDEHVVHGLMLEIEENEAPRFIPGVTALPDLTFVKGGSVIGGSDVRWYVPLDWIYDPEGVILSNMYEIMITGISATTDTSWLRVSDGNSVNDPHIRSAANIRGTIVSQPVPSDAKTASPYTVTIDVDDGGGNTFTTSFMISFSAVGGGVSPPVFGSTMYDFMVAENGEDTLVGTVSASDADGDTIYYSVVDRTESTLFYFKDGGLGGSMGNSLYTRKALDFEDVSSYTFDVRAQSGGRYSTVEVTVMVVDVTNEALVLTMDWGSDIYVEEDRDVSYDFSVVLGAGETAAYSVSGTDSGDVSINATGQLMFISTPDFEMSTDANLDGVYEFAVEVSVGVRTLTHDVMFHVLDVWDHAPVVARGIADQTAMEGDGFDFRVPAGTFTDADVGDVLTYSFTWTGAIPWLFDVGGGRLYSAYVPAGSAGDIEITVTATDDAGNMVTDMFDLGVTAASFEDDSSLSHEGVSKSFVFGGEEGVDILMTWSDDSGL